MLVFGPQIATLLFAHGRSSPSTIALLGGVVASFGVALVPFTGYMEFIRPMPSWEDFHQSPVARETFRKFRTPGEGEAMILEGNAFIERVLPGSIKRKLSDEEMAAYRNPFLTPESRRPIWRLPNELPIEGKPADVHDAS